jgi:Xaa-Pro aminopeptidase
MTTTVQTRVSRLAAEIDRRELDLLLVTDPVNVRWLTGFTGSSGVALLGATQDGTRRFVTDFRYLSQSDEQVDESWTHEIAQDLDERVVAGLPTGRPLRLGFDDAHVSVKQHTRLTDLVPDTVTLVGAGGAVEALRAVKDAEEIERIRAAAHLADAALQEVLTRGLAGRTEREVGLDLEFTMRRAGAESVSFPPIIASGAHAALPHATPRDVVIPRDVLVTIDWGAQLDGYASDCTRTYATGEGIDARDREIYALVLHAQEEALAAVRPGPTGREIDAVARGIIDAAGHAEHFGHGLGHGVGMEVHEGPRLSRTGEAALRAGNVVTVEPGVYLPGAAGVRIEDLVAVTEDGHDVLNTLPKGLTVIS